MFDIAFSEILVISVVALIVIGPERLPKVARTLGHLWGRMQRYVNGVKADISRDMALDEVRKVQQEVTQEVASVTEEMSAAARQLDEHLQGIDPAILQSAALNQSPVKHHSSVTFETPEPEKSSEVRIPMQKTFPLD